MSNQKKLLCVRQHNLKKALNPARLALLFVLFGGAITPSYATINCAGFLPSSYFERIKNNPSFTGKLVEQANGTQQLTDLDGNVVIDNLNNAYILMDKYVLAQKNGKYGVVNAAGKIIVAFKYDDIQTEPDISTSFIVSVGSSAANTKQGIINRYGDWIYPLADVRIQHTHYDADYDQDYFIVTNNKSLTGLLDDRGYWAIMPQYEVINPLNPCTGQPLYLQVSLQNKTALIDQSNNIIIPFLANQHIESFNNNVSPLLFLRSSLSDGVDAGMITAMSEDIQEYIVSADIIDANGKVILASESPIRKLLYHQLYTFKQNGKYGIINDKGDVILKPQFKSYHDDGHNVWVEKQREMVLLNSLLELD
jgi:hypothetical protein